MKFLSRLVSNVHNTFITLKYEIRIEDTYCFDILNESAEAARTTMSAVIEKSTSSCVKTLPENLIHLLLMRDLNDDGIRRPILPIAYTRRRLG